MARVSSESREQDRDKAKVLIQRIGQRLAPTEPVKTQIDFAARSLRWRLSRAREVWYGNAKRIEAYEMLALENKQSR